jgi:hypothetical protein
VGLFYSFFGGRTLSWLVINIEGLADDGTGREELGIRFTQQPVDVFL